MDSSDGLADAIVQICHASGVGAILDLDHLPGLLEVPGFERDRALNWTLYGGEDFELVLCLAPQWTHWLVAQETSPLRNARVIGRVTAELGCFVQDATDAIILQQFGYLTQVYGSYDPAVVGFNENYCYVHPHPHTKPVQVTSKQYAFLERANRIFLKGVVDLTSSVTIKLGT